MLTTGCTAIDEGLHHAAVLDHRDLVGLGDRGEPVGDHDGGASLPEATHRLGDARLGHHVEVAGGLVQHQQSRVGDPGPGERDELALPGRQQRAPPTSVSKPAGSPSMTVSAPTARAAASTSSLAASGRPKRMLSATDPENRSPVSGKVRLLGGADGADSCGIALRILSLVQDALAQLSSRVVMIVLAGSGPRPALVERLVIGVAGWCRRRRRRSPPGRRPGGRWRRRCRPPRGCRIRGRPGRRGRPGCRCR